MKEKNTKKALKKRLSAVAFVYLDGLGKKKKARLERYLDKKLDGVMNCYFNLIKKKKKTKPFSSPVADEPDLTGLTKHENDNAVIIEPSDLNTNPHEDAIK